MADNLPLSSADITESGSLNLPEPSGPHRAVMGLLYFTILVYTIRGTLFGTPNCKKGETYLL
jgi:hypothetical protein